MLYPFYEPMINVSDIPALKSSNHLTRHPRNSTQTTDTSTINSSIKTIKYKIL